MNRHNVYREGFIAGIIGATAVAIWFFFLDLIAAHPLYTPEIMGRTFLSILGPDRGDSRMVAVAFYTVLHYAVFVFVGIVATAIIHASQKRTTILAGALILFVIFQIGFYILTALVAESPLGALAWYQVFAANLIATVLMGTYLWRSHPNLGRRLDLALGGREAR